MTATLATPAMQSPHESVLVNQRRGLLGAVMGSPSTYPGVLDLYDLTADCREPRLLSSLPVGFLGHESGFSPDGRTFWSSSLFNGTIAAIDVSDPTLPRTLWIGQHSSHGIAISPDGNRAYLSALGGGLTILDVSDIQARRPNPRPRVVSRLSWPELTVPQNSEPVTIGGRPYLVETDEFATQRAGEPSFSGAGPVVGAARLIDIADDRRPRVVSNLRLAVHEPEHRATIAEDPGTASPGQGFAGHYCGVPRQRDPGIAACSMIGSGLRVFDIRDPRRPRELAYFVRPVHASSVTPDGANYAMARPAFDARHGEIWYSDAGSGFYALRVARGIWPFNSGGPALGLPSANRCRVRRAFGLRLPRRLRAAQVRADGRRVRLRGRRARRVRLRGPAGAVHTVRVRGRTRDGRRVRTVRRYRICS